MLSLSRKCTVLSACLWLLAVTSTARAENAEAPLLTGETWEHMEPDSKAAFIWGITTLLEFERHSGEMDTQPEKCKNSLIPIMIENLTPKGFSITQIVAEVDDYYRENPGDLRLPVMHVLFKTVIFPRRSP